MFNELQKIILKKEIPNKALTKWDYKSPLEFNLYGFEDIFYDLGLKPHIEKGNKGVIFSKCYFNLNDNSEITLIPNKNTITVRFISDKVQTFNFTKRDIVDIRKALRITKKRDIIFNFSEKFSLAMQYLKKEVKK